MNETPGALPSAAAPARVARLVERVLAPGDLAFGGQELRLRTTLGSCVAVALWHPTLNVGGMCHYLVPSRKLAGGQELDGRYAEEAMELLINAMRKHGAPPQAYETKVFGGGNMFPGIPQSDQMKIGLRNVEAARALLPRLGLRILTEDVLGIVYRHVIFEVGSGAIWVRRQPANITVIAQKRGTNDR